MSERAGCLKWPASEIHPQRAALFPSHLPFPVGWQPDESNGMLVNSASLGFFCAGFFWMLASPEDLWRQQAKVENSRYCPWDCMRFVQMWPGSFCVALERRFECVLPKDANSWTIHGLWPSYVRDCCSYWHLFPSDLVDLMSELDRHWPTFTNISNFQFWEKEWQKHGTCASCIETLNSPNKYFQAALILQTKYNIDGAFQRAAIVPSCSRSYQLSTFVTVLQPTLGDQYELQCVTDAQGRQILVQIKVSLYSNFSTGCSSDLYDISPYKPCSAERKVFYFPPNQENPRNPCP
ncbi:ribonuclease Oy-like isoform X2 [Rhineura floridana]|uniref:ribonuclease Oy-like isoform X2 n=1 Tax=Rhineura floridana TaxID=261503 RepID=UPI002AC7FDF6|nr:ribonuclease Oy-like isoform X2 [Rhineura floridana]